MRAFITLITRLTTSTAMAASATFTFINQTHYVFLHSDQAAACAIITCLDVIGPG